MLNAIPSLLLAIVAGVEASDTMRSIERAWNDRAATIRNGEFEWESMVDDRVPLKPGPLRENPKALEVRSHLRIDGQRRHFRYHGEQWSEDGREVVPLDSTQAFLRGEYRIVGIRLPGQQYHYGYLQSTDENRLCVATFPVFWALSELTINFKDARIDGENIDCRGRPTTLLREDQGSTYWLYWLDPAAGFEVRRAASYRDDGSCMRQFDIEYSVNDVSDAVPSSWKMISFSGNGRIKTSESAKMVRFSINRDFSDKDFELDFPNETYVHDFRDGTGGYLIDASGKRVSHFSPIPDNPARSHAGKAFVAVNVFFLLSIVLALLVKRARRSRVLDPGVGR